ncbi:DUF4817 domain-containing protein [Trichonephila clavipes]|nr:DUF4817 domain-containing protein [Trichonephila clavipes]
MRSPVTEGKKELRGSMPIVVCCFKDKNLFFGSICLSSGIVTLTAVPQGLGSNLGEEDMDVYKCIVPVRHGGTIHLNNHRAASHLLRLVEGQEIWEIPRVYSLKIPTGLSGGGSRVVKVSNRGLPCHDDEAHFRLNGCVNKQNWRIWSEANPQVYVETPLHPEKLTVWCALWAGGIIGPYFFKNDEGHNVTVNRDRYRAMITNFFIPELNNHDVQELWFQQDGATCHTARATIDLLKDTFGDRLISRFGPVNWPPRSCDLTPLDYFLWGYVKSLVYADKPQTLDHLEDNFCRVISDIRPQMLEKVIENWTTSEPAVAVLYQKSYLKYNATRLSFE